MELRDILCLIGLAVTLLAAIKLGQIADLAERMARAHRHWRGLRK